MKRLSGQNYSNHRRIVPGFTFLLFFFAPVTVIGACVNLSCSIYRGAPVYSASLICCLAIIIQIGLIYTRTFALKAQDRAIRAEENFRHFMLAGKQLDSRLRLSQIIALRFASDNELQALALRAATEDLKPDEIKRAITHWKGDYHRV